jgi:hypothetical protein
MTKPFGCDVNGYPLDPNHPWNRPEEEQARERERLFGRRMYLLERDWRAGDATAIAEGVRECRLAQQPPPRWLADAVAAWIERQMDAAEKRSRRDLAIHMKRWEEVTELHERGHDLLEQHGDDDRGTSLERCYVAVSEFGAEAGVSDETIKASYKLIQNAGGVHTTLESCKLAVQQRDRRGNK